MQFPGLRRSAAIACLFYAVSGPIPSAASPAKDFPEFPQQKPNLGNVALIGDAVVVEDVLGKVEKVYVEDCKKLGGLVLDAFASAMKAKGYTVDPKPLLSVGLVADAKTEFHVLSTWEQHTEKAENFPVARPPFYVDSTLAPNDEARSAWASVLNGAWAFKKKKKQPAPTFPEIAKLHDTIGADHALVILVVGTKIPFGKQFLQGMASAPATPVASSGNVTVSVGVNFQQFSGTALRVAMLDCKTGDVLWADDGYAKKTIKEDQVDDLAKGILKRLP